MQIYTDKNAVSMKRRASYLEDLAVSISLAEGLDLTRVVEYEQGESESPLQNQHTMDLDKELPGFVGREESGHVYAGESNDETFPIINTAASNATSLSGTMNIPATIGSSHEIEQPSCVHDDNSDVRMKDHRGEEEEEELSPPLCINAAVQIEKTYVKIPARLLYYEEDQDAMSQHPFRFNGFEGQEDSDKDKGEEAMLIKQDGKDGADGSIDETEYALTVKSIRDGIWKEKRKGEQEPIYSLNRLPQFHTLFSANANLIVGCRDVQSEL